MGCVAVAMHAASSTGTTTGAADLSAAKSTDTAASSSSAFVPRPNRVDNSVTTRKCPPPSPAS